MSKSKYTEVYINWVKNNLKKERKGKKIPSKPHVHDCNIRYPEPINRYLSQPLNLNHLADLKVDMGTIFLFLFTILCVALTSSSLVIKSTAAANTL